jgi:uncharacterized glyoxalase superfamily protein PhnB
MSATTGPSIAPWLAVTDAQRAVDSYQAAFGAVELYRLASDGGTLQVAQLSISPDSGSGERCSGSKTTSTPALTAGAQDRFG